MSEKPKKRLVGWTQYLMTIQDKSLHYVAGSVCGIGGLLFLMFSAFLFYALLSEGVDAGFFLSLTGGGAAFGIFLLWAGTAIFKNAKEIAPVALITRHNTGQLPAVETLVRASDIPLSQQQAELLRAAPQGKKTPAEELLRAGHENRQD